MPEFVYSASNSRRRTLFRRLPWRAIFNRALLLIFAAVFVLLFPAATPSGNSLYERVLGQAKGVLFNYVAWEIQAVAAKIAQVQSGIAPFLDEPARSAFVVGYLQRVARLQTLDRDLEAIFSNPAVRNAEQASAELRAERDRLKTEVAQQQSLAEAIIETQVASVLRDEGFATLGEVLPPVSAHITELPMLLVISPRHVIRRDLAINTVYLSADDVARLESAIDARLDVSSLVVPLGGLALYPSMVLQTWYSPYVFETVAHEWAHHYLYFFPLGLEYLNTGSETWIINETTASLFGREIGRKTIERFYADYPEIVRQLPPPEPPFDPNATPTPTPDPRTPRPFDISAAMNETRLRVDALLAEGKIVEAEQYMEQQRQLFAANGHTYRKINQAFFAFYGGYQSPSGGGSAGADPIGPAVAHIRRSSPSIRAWLETMRTITSREQLLAVRNALQ